MAIDKSTENDKADKSALVASYEALGAQDQVRFIDFVAAKGRKLHDPLSAEGMEMQALFVQEMPDHPMDVMKRIMSNMYCTPSERMSAAKTLMEYSMRKVPSTIDVNQTTSALKIDASALGALSLEELETLQNLLAKANAPSA